MQWKTKSIIKKENIGNEGEMYGCVFVWCGETICAEYYEKISTIFEFIFILFLRKLFEYFDFENGFQYLFFLDALNQI